MNETKMSFRDQEFDIKDVLATSDKYKVKNLIAKGGMAIVFEAKDKNCRRPVALKVIRDNESCTKEVLHRFIEEAQIAAQLDHPNILPVYDLNLDSQNNPYYTMKLVNGQTLEKVIMQIKEGDEETIKNYPLGKLMQIYMKICEAVAFAGSKGVVHRDLKPENIMIGTYGEVFIMDWGIAKILNHADLSASADDSSVNKLIDSISKDRAFNIAKTMQGQILGTPGFMAPEQVYSTRGVIDERTDVYGLGGILYYLLTLDMPHNEINLKELFQNKMSGNIPSPEKKAMNASFPQPHLPGGRVPPALNSICLKAMALRPKDRYLSAKELLEDVQSYIQGFATQAEGASQLRLLTLLFLRHKRLGFALTLLMAMIALYLTQNYFKLEYAQTTTESATGFAEDIQLKTDLYEDAIVSKEKSGKLLQPYFIEKINELIAKGGTKELREAYRLSNHFQLIVETPEVYEKQVKILLKLSKNTIAANTLKKALQKFPTSQKLQNLQNSLKNE